MSVVVFIFYFIVIMIIIVNILKISKAFKANDRMFDNIEGIVRQRYNSIMQNNQVNDSKVENDIDKSVDLDNFIKSNSNPIKETKGKRSKI